jgi:hypothetical protein
MEKICSGEKVSQVMMSACTPHGGVSMAIPRGPSDPHCSASSTRVNAPCGRASAHADGPATRHHLVGR